MSQQCVSKLIRESQCLMNNHSSENFSSSEEENSSPENKKHKVKFVHYSKGSFQQRNTIINRMTCILHHFVITVFQNYSRNKQKDIDTLRDINTNSGKLQTHGTKDLSDKRLSGKLSVQDINNKYFSYILNYYCVF